MCKTGILVHGCHLQALEWRRIVWGDPPNLLGRIPKAIYIAWRDNAEKMIFGTGASSAYGDPEGAFMRNYMLNHFDDLMQFSTFADNWELDDLQNVLRPFIEEISQVDVDSQNTTQEIRYALDTFAEVGITDIILVSSPTHLPRCLRDACVELLESGNTYPDLHRNLYAAPSDTCYAGYKTSDVEIIEPPHRGDRSKVELHPLVKQLRQRFYELGDTHQKVMLTDFESFLP